MTMVFVRPLQGRDPLSVPIRGFVTHGYSTSSPLGMGNAAQMLSSTVVPKGKGEHANASSTFGECRLRSHAPKLGATAARPSPTRPNALAHSALPDEPNGSASPLGRGRGEGEGISLSITAFFSAVGSGLNSTANNEEPTGIIPVSYTHLTLPTNREV